MKRLDEVESQLTPKEWAIRLADEMRKSSHTEFVKKTASAFKAFPSLQKQAEEKYPGTKPADIQARHRLYRELQTEYHALKKLIGQVNEAVMNRAEKAGLEAALKISTLQTTILQDAFGRTARKAAGWIEVYETEGKDEEENRKVMLSELQAYMDVNFGEKATDSLPIGDIKLRFPTIIENWIKAAVVLIEDLYSHRAAVQIIQDKQFDDHPILDLTLEADLKKTIRAVEDSVESFNEYLDVRGRLFKAEWEEEEEHEGGYVTAIPGEREGMLKIDLEKIKAESVRAGKELAKVWMTDARDEAVFDIRQAEGDGDAAFDELALKRGWVKP
jgi:hypothetical protein